jgi:cytochrome c oxidase subunit 4
MSTTADNPPAAEIRDDAAPHEHDHPSDLKYVKIALILAAITAVEVGTYFFEMSTTALVAFLFPMMIAKFLIVTAYFMHLKYDNPLFRRVFFFGLILAIAVFMVALTAFEFWDDDFLKFLR